MPKGFAQPLLIIFVVVAIIGVIFYQNTKTNNLLKNPQSLKVKSQEFKNYSNSLGFEFKYPNNLIVKEDSEEEFSKRGTGANNKGPVGDYRKNFKSYVGYDPGKLLGAVAVLTKEGKYDLSPLSIWIFENPNNLTTTSWFNKYWYYPFLWGVFDYTSKGHVTPDSEATISGQIAKYKVISYQPGKPKFLYISKDQKMYLFRVIGESGENILSTFQFI